MSMRKRVDYDNVAAGYDNRYAQNDYAGVRRALAGFVLSGLGPDQQHVVEVGCGTGHWLKFLGDAGVPIFGVDPSAGMLAMARANVLNGRLVRARAEALPLRSALFSRIVCINALHHFTDRAAFFGEARRLLGPGGGLLTIGLDPHAGADRWWIYDYFPEALVEDRKRYSPASAIRELMENAGFSRCETVEVQHLPRRMTVSEAARCGFLDRTNTSQFMVITEAEYRAGLNRIHAADAVAPGEKILCADLRLYGTTGWAV